MKIGIIGDLHISPAPAKRIDDYFQTGLNKIEEIAQFCDYAIFLGDIFTSAKIDETYLIRLIQHIQYCKATYSVDFATIIGNHDVISEEESNLQSSSLGVLDATGVMKIIKPEQPLIINDGSFSYRFNTIPVKFKNAKKYDYNKFGKEQYIDILLVHHEYETGTNCFSYNDFKDCGCKMIFFGHDHKPLDGGRIIYPEFTAYRSGSIMRNRADDYNLTRPCYYYIIENNMVSCKAVTTKPAEEVFTIEAVTQIDYKKRKFTESIDTIIDRYKNNISTESRFSIKSIMMELNTPQENIDYIKQKHDFAGERFD